jgi:excisionase family DNA binding protein
VTAGSPIESGLFAVVCAALDDRLRPVLERLTALEARLSQLEPDEEGLSYKQAARVLGISAKTVGRWVEAKKITAGGTRRSPRIARSEIRRVLLGRSTGSTSKSSANQFVEGLDMTALARGVLSAGSKSRKRV